MCHNSVIDMYNIPVKDTYKYAQYHMIMLTSTKYLQKITNMQTLEKNVNLTTGHIIKLIFTSRTSYYNQQLNKRYSYIMPYHCTHNLYKASKNKTIYEN